MYVCINPKNHVRVHDKKRLETMNICSKIYSHLFSFEIDSFSFSFTSALVVASLINCQKFINWTLLNYSIKKKTFNIIKSRKYHVSR